MGDDRRREFFLFTTWAQVAAERVQKADGRDIMTNALLKGFFCFDSFYSVWVSGKGGRRETERIVLGGKSRRERERERMRFVVWKRYRMPRAEIGGLNIEIGV